MTENTRIEYKRELTDGLEKGQLNVDEKISGAHSGAHSEAQSRAQSGVERGVESAMVCRLTCSRVGHCKEFK